MLLVSVQFPSSRLENLWIVVTKYMLKLRSVLKSLDFHFHITDANFNVFWYIPLVKTMKEFAHLMVYLHFPQGWC